MRDPNLDYCPDCGREVGSPGRCQRCSPKFAILPHDGIAKSFGIVGPIDLEVDYDDVDQEEQDLLSRYVVRVLNDHWDDPEYAGLRLELEQLQERRNQE